MEKPDLDVFGIVSTTVGGAYEVESVVAEGGFAVIYRALHTGFSAPVALKCLKLSQKLSKERQATFLAQFRAEAELLFQLSSGIPSVVRPLHVDALTTKDGTFVPYIVLEWLHGETLDAYVERRRSEGRAPLSLKKLVRLLTPVARALERAHNFRGPRGPVSIVHRDLKPENIFIAQVAGEEVVKILDFGVARAQSVASQVAGDTSDVGGPGFFTPAYAAPEQWLPKRYGQTGPWTDVWGLALTLVEAMKGDAVIDGDVQSMMTAALDKQRRPTPRVHGIEVSDPVEALFGRALALDPRQRPADVGVFWDELTRALGLKVEDRHRDARTEAGEVPREERIEAAIGARAVAVVQRGAVVRDEQSSSRVRVVTPFEPDSSTRQAVARPVDPDLDSGPRVAVAKVALVPKSPPRAAPIPRDEPARAGPAPSELDPCAPLDIQLATTPPDAPRRIQTGPQRPYVQSAPSLPPEPALWPRLSLGAGLIVAAIVLALADRALSASGQLPLGPVRATWIAALLVVAGVCVIIHRLLPRDRA